MQRSIFGEAVKGASHKNNNISCQDAFKIEHLSESCSIVAVADGHGSSACPYSKYGSAMAVNTFCYIIRRIYVLKSIIRRFIGGEFMIHVKEISQRFFLI